LGSALTSLLDAVPTLLFLIVFAGVGEEFGWRGFALPRLHTRYNALTSSLIVGIFHTLWHIPLFFIPGVNQYDLAQRIGFFPAFLGYAGLVLALGVQIAWIFNNTRGSVLLAAVYHGAINTWNGHIGIDRGETMKGPFVYTAIMVVLSIVIVAVFGPENLSRTHPRPTLDPHLAES
jgi:uncharacterized protein